MSKKEISSGAQKAEDLAKNGSEKKTDSTKKRTTTKTKKNNAVKQSKPAAEKRAVKSEKKQNKKGEKRVKHVSERRAARKEALKQKKLEAAKIRAEKKQKRLEKKLEAKQKRLDRIAAMKEKRADRREKRRERRDMLKHESKEARLTRIKEERAAKTQARVAKRQAALADKKAKREHKLRMRAEKRKAASEKQHAPGFGGWLAAVIALGVTTLALGTMLTFGWINMNGMHAEMATAHTESIYELNSIVDNLDTNLSKARVSSSNREQVKLLTDIAIESEMAETVLERLPLDGQMTENMTSFVNKMADSAQQMLYSVANGNTLTESQIATIEHMYRTNLQMKKVLNDVTANTNGKEMLAAMRGKQSSMLYSGFDEIQNNTIETPKEINDGPFAENVKKASAKNLKGMKEISAATAEDLAAKYFGDYKVTDVRCTGETVAEQLTLFNVTMTTDDGEMSAQISKQGGKVVEFNSYKDCTDKNFSVERCVAIAQDFLKDLGYTNMKPVWTSENGTTCNLNFVYEQDGVIVYADMVKVKVCEQRGIVTGMEALSYVLNHTERSIPTAKISKNEAKAKLHDGFKVEGSRLCTVPLDGNEVLCYEFFGTYQGSDYYIYIDAATGEETQVFTVIGTKQGKALM